MMFCTRLLAAAKSFATAQRDVHITELVHLDELLGRQEIGRMLNRFADVFFGPAVVFDD